MPPRLGRLLDPSAGYKLSCEQRDQGEKFPRLHCEARKGKKVVADATFKPTSRTKMFALAVHTDKAHRRRGLASAMYALAQQTSGRKIVPSKDQLEDGKKLWAGAGGKAFGRKTSRSHR